MFADCDWVEVEGMKKDFLDLMSKSHEYFKRFKSFFYVAVPSASLLNSLPQATSREREILNWNELRFLFQI